MLEFQGILLGYKKTINIVAEESGNIKKYKYFC